jgi:hypothetical protein
MLFVDIPTRADMEVLAKVRKPACVSIYLKTTPLTQDIGASQIALGNFIREAETQLQSIDFDKRQLATLVESLKELQEDDEFWRFQAHSLAIFASTEKIRTYRLPNTLTPMVQVSDRLHLKPLFRAITFPHSAFILALSENAVSLLEMHNDAPPTEVSISDMPSDASSAVGKSTINDRSHSGRLVGDEGQNVRLEQYARKIDNALRTVMAGRDTPLILASTGRLASIFPRINSYPNLLGEIISDSPDRMTEQEIGAAARPILDKHYAQQLSELRDLYQERKQQRRTTTDMADAAKAATFGAIDTLMVDIDSVVPGYVDDETGAITLVGEDDAKAYGIVDEITARALANGAKIFGVRKEDLPEGEYLAAILRYPL